jgi:hypothetical protein
MNQVKSAGLGGEQSPANDTRPIPVAAIWVTVYHFLLLVINALLITVLYINKGPNGLVPMGGLGQLPATAVYSFGFGIIGGVLYASRWVIYAVARQDYLYRKILWQVVSPLHGGVLAVFVVIAVKAGVLGVAGVETNSPDVASRYVWFVMALSFLSGFASKIVIERVEEMTRALFGMAPNTIPDPKAETETSESGPDAAGSSDGAAPKGPVANG